jgi:hypothetical protein
MDAAASPALLVVTSTHQVGQAAAVSTVLVKVKKEISTEQRAVESKKHVAHRNTAKLQAIKVKEDATKVKRLRFCNMHEVVLCILLPELSKIGEISSGPMLKMLP